MKKVLAFMMIFAMLPMAEVSAAQEPLNDSAYEEADKDNDTSGPFYDSMEKKFDEYRSQSREEWKSKGNAELFGDEERIKTETLYSDPEDQLKKMFFDVRNMLPGDKISKIIRISNESSTPYTLKLKGYRDKKENDNYDLFDKINLKIMKNHDVIYNGRLFDDKNLCIGNENVECIDLGTINPNDKAVIFTAEVSLDLDTGKEYQNKETDVDWIFIADKTEPSKDNPKDDSKDNPLDNPSENPVKLVPVGNKDDSYSIVDYNSAKGPYRGSVSKTGDNNVIIIYIALACGSLLISFVLFSKGKKDGKKHEK